MKEWNHLPQQILFGTRCTISRRCVMRNANPYRTGILVLLSLIAANYEVTLMLSGQRPERVDMTAAGGWCINSNTNVGRAITPVEHHRCRTNVPIFDPAPKSPIQHRTNTPSANPTRPSPHQGTQFSTALSQLRSNFCTDGPNPRATTRSIPHDGAI